MDQISQKARRERREKREARREKERDNLVKIEKNYRDDDPDWCDDMEVEPVEAAADVPGDDQAEDVVAEVPVTARKQAVMVTLESKEYKAVLKEAMHVEELPRKVIAKEKEKAPEEAPPRPTTPQPIPKGQIAQKLQSENIEINQKDKLIKVEALKREINKEDMKILRKEAASLAEEEKHMFRDGNARDKMCYSLLIQSCKMIDLWDQANHYMDVIELKTGELDKVQGKLTEKTTEREGLEHDNEVLRVWVTKNSDQKIRG